LCLINNKAIISPDYRHLYGTNIVSTQVKAVIFDMDGILIDSEPAWQIAEQTVLNGCGLNLSREEVEQTTGMRIDHVVSYWYQRFPWPNYDNAATATKIVNEVIAQINANGEPMLGVIESLDACKRLGLKIGLATSSSSRIIEAVLHKLTIGHYFDAIESAENLAYGKPHPEVYLNCATGLGIAPSQCIAIEDSFNGLIAARAASMQTVAIPAPHTATQTKWVIAHHQLAHAGLLPALLGA
jgi:HAD superfamily hydrolase (TIGR01509 family)